MYHFLTKLLYSTHPKSTTGATAGSYVGTALGGIAVGAIVGFLLTTYVNRRRDKGMWETGLDAYDSAPRVKRLRRAHASMSRLGQDIDGPSSASASTSFLGPGLVSTVLMAMVLLLLQN